MSEETKATKHPWWKPSIGVTIFLMLFGLWGGIPTYNKWRADNMVDELCAKDGGIKVYETVILPAPMFNKYGQPEIGLSKNKPSQNGLYFDLNIEDLVGNHNSSAIRDLVVMRSKTKIVRNSDRKTLGEKISYTRRGGDAAGPWHPSHYTCPPNVTGWDLATKVILMADK